MIPGSALRYVPARRSVMHMTQTGTPTTLGRLTPGSEILSITTPAGDIHRPEQAVTFGALLPGADPARLIVRSAKVHGKNVIVGFTNGRVLLACAATTPCTAV